jgi:hypothetical protein
VIKALQRRFGIRKVRISKNIYAAGQPVSPALTRRKHTFNWALRNLYSTCTTEGFTELLSYRAELSRGMVTCRSVELMVHPGASYAANEVQLLQSDWLAESGLAGRLINYNQL